MKVYSLCLNPFGTNCYILIDELSSIAVVVDPCCYFRRERERLLRLISRNGWNVVYILATHMHIDHVCGAAFLARKLQCPFGASPLDDYWVGLAPERCRQLGLAIREPMIKASLPLRHGDCIRFGNEALNVIGVPGHSPGSLVFCCGDMSCLFSGDTLFKGDVGRTDLPGGNAGQLAGSIRNRLFCLPDHTVVYPGHGLPTTIGREKTANAYL